MRWGSAASTSTISLAPTAFGLALLHDGDGSRGRRVVDAHELEAARLATKREVLLHVGTRPRGRELAEKLPPPLRVGGIEHVKPSPELLDGRGAGRRALRRPRHLAGGSERHDDGHQPGMHARRDTVHESSLVPPAAPSLERQKGAVHTAASHR